MANLPNETITTVLNLERRLLQLINEATAARYIILEQYGEIQATIIALDQLQNVRERATSFYIRLYRLLLQISESQPVATSATLNLLRGQSKKHKLLLMLEKQLFKKLKKRAKFPSRSRGRDESEGGSEVSTRIIFPGIQ